MSIQIEVDYASQSVTCPSLAMIQIWVEAALKNRKESAFISIKMLDEEEMTHLNATYRNKSQPTNVLSFACELPEALRGYMLGDIALCAPVVIKEAALQHKDPISHFAHLIIHGTLHLLGYDHEIEQEALIMENIETDILLNLGFADPYKAVILQE